MKRIAIAAHPTVVLHVIFACAFTAQTPLLSPQTGSRTISGVVVSAKNGQLLAGAEVSLAPADSSDHAGNADAGSNSAKQTVITSDDEGRFSFEHIANGRYRLQAAHTGYITAAYDEHPGGVSTAIVAGEGLTTTGLKIALSPQAVIRGAITEDSGDPISDGTIHLFRKDIYGTGKMVSAGSTTTDSEGNFEFRHLSAGSYYLCVSAAPWYVRYAAVSPNAGRPSVIDKAYPITCYPGVTDSSNAEPIEVSEGERFTANLILLPVPAVHLQVGIPGLEDSGPMIMPIPTLQQSMFGITLEGPWGSMMYSGSGGAKPMYTAHISGVPPGQYTLSLQDLNNGSERFMSVDLTQGGDEELKIASSAMISPVDVSGKIAMADGGALPADLTLVATGSTGELPKMAQAESDGNFHLTALERGDYELAIRSSRAGVQIVKLTASGAAARGDRFSVGSEPVALTVLAARTVAAVSGVVEVSGKPAGGVFVLLVPAGTSLGSDALRPYQSDSDGSFTLPKVIAGKYTLIAVEEGWTLDWARPEALANYLRLGKKITVRLDFGEIHLQEPIEAQSK